MSVIGNTPTSQNFVAGTDYFNGTGSQTAFTLTRTISSVNDISVVINNVVQQPNTAYTILGNVVTFTSAPSAGTANIYVRYLSTTTQTITPSAGTVGWNQLTADVQQDLGTSFKNRIINGAMVIDQRNAGASATQAVAVVFGVDRWWTYGQQASKFTLQQSTDAPVGFKNSTKITSSSAYAVSGVELYQFTQSIEGNNVSDLSFGTANAKTITLSFWVKSSLTGTFGAFLGNSAGNRMYPASYTINSANTWEQKSITITGDTIGVWLTDNGLGLRVGFSLGAGSSLLGTANTWNTTAYAPTGATSVVGTSGATFYITGVQLETGSTASAFDFRSYGTELALCQRYFEKSWDAGTSVGTATVTGLKYSAASGGANTTGYLADGIIYQAPKRATPTITTYDNAGNSGKLNRENIGVGTTNNVVSNISPIGTSTTFIYTSGSSTANGVSYHYTISAEL